MPDQEQYDRICKCRFDTIERKIDALDDRLDRIFIDNGGESLQSKVNANSKLLKLVTGVFALIGSAIISILVWIIKSKL